MKVFFHSDFYEVYTSDPAASAGRMEAIVEALGGYADFVEPRPATKDELHAVHSPFHVEHVKQIGLYDIAALAAGAAIQAAETGLTEPCFGLIRPPGHHASAEDAWGFCYFNNMAAALTALKASGKIKSAFILDFDLHYGDGNVNILSHLPWVSILNPATVDRSGYLEEVRSALTAFHGDVIGVSAGFDHHVEDWGGLLTTEDYHEMGAMVREAALKNTAGSFGILEGGYNHDVLGRNVLAFLQGLDSKA